MSTVTLNWNRVMQSVRLYPREVIEKGFWQVLQHDAALQKFIADSGDKNLVMGILFNVFRTSIEQTNADKEYFLRRLADQNEISEALTDYLKKLLRGEDATHGPYRCRSKDEPDSWLPIH